MYSLALTVHIVTVCTLVPIILYTDHYGLSWVRGKRETLSRKKLRVLHRLIYVGLGLMILSGGYMFAQMPEYLLSLLTFQVKLGFIITLIINSILIGKFMHVAIHRSFASLSREERVPLFVVGVISTLCWIGSISAALLLPV